MYKNTVLGLLILFENVSNVDCILNPGYGKNSNPGFQFLYTKRQIPNIIKV